MSTVSPDSLDVQPGLDALLAHLIAEGYSMHARGSILDYVRTEGTLAGAPGLDPGDEEPAEYYFEQALPAVPLDDPCWSVVSGPWSVVRSAGGNGWAPHHNGQRTTDHGPKALAEIESSFPAGWPRNWTEAERHQHADEIAAWYRLHPES